MDENGLLGGLKLIAALGLGVITVLITLFVAIFITAIFNDTVATQLGLSNGSLDNITSLTGQIFKFIGYLISAVGIVGTLVILVIVISVFGVGWKAYKSKKSGGKKSKKSGGMF